MDFCALIEKYRSSDLQELHKLLFKKTTSDNRIKNNLKTFHGFAAEDFEANVDYAVQNFDSEELVTICQQLEITPIENSLEDAKSLIRKLTSTHKLPINSTPIPIEADHRQEDTSSQQSSKNDSPLEELTVSQQSTTISAIRQQSKIVHELRKQLLNLEEVQLDLSESSEEYSTVSKKIFITQKKITLEENRRLELLEENNLQNREVNAIKPSNTSFHSEYNRDLHALLLKTPQNLKLIDFNGSSCLDWHYFLLQYNSSTIKYKLSKEENLLRLNEHITGDARLKVDLLLKSSKDPSGIINILDIQYGGTDRVIKEIIKRAQNIKKVISLQYFKDFNCTLQNVSSVISQIDDDSLDIQRLLSTLLEKLPDHFISQWANFLITKDLKQKNIQFKIFSDWINHMSEIVSEVAFNNSIKELDYEQTTSSTKKEIDRNTPTTSKPSNRVCKLCQKEDHPLYKCLSFKALDVKKRFTTAKKLNFCIFCLNKHFGYCRKRQLCSIDNCSKFHHELLHEKEQANNVTACIQSRSTVLLKMLPVNLKVNNKIVKIIAFLDDGSTLSLIDKSIADEIGLIGSPEPINFQWTGDIYREDSTSRNLSLEISSESSKNFYQIDDVHTVDDLKLPQQRINITELLKSYPELQNVNISNSYDGCPVLLLGQKHANLITNRQTIEIPNGGPFVSQTKLGWAVHGPVNISGKDIGSFVCYMTHNDSLEQIISNQFKLENFDLPPPKKDIENEKVIEHLEKSITKCNDHYEVGLPWKDNISETKIPDSMPLAKQRLIYLEKKLLKDKVLLDSYQTQIDKLLEKNYARKIKFSDLKDKSRYWILPHFPVFNPKKPHKPARIVFDASAKVQNSSLNDFLNQGPDWLCSILGILLRFRQNKIAFIGDICEMFNRVKIRDCDTFAQCFLWRNVNVQKPIELYQMKALLFGLNCAPFIAQFVKNYNAAQHKQDYPEAFEAITQSHYVDDFVESRDSLEESIKLINDVIQVHKFGGFQIRSFVSNKFELIQHIPRELVSDEMFKDEYVNIQKVLGMFWDVKSDQFHFIYKFFKTNSEILNGKKLPTKKEFLQILMAIYDPLGLLTPIVIKGKILFQSIWKSKIGWNHIIPEELKKKWFIWMEEVSKLKEFLVPRCYKINILTPESSQLHIFCDASINSYCAVAYLRLKEDLKIEISLTYSKSRVTPISSKNITIPKLELMACVLGVRIANLIKEHLSITSIHFWTDSMVALAWISSKKYLKAFEKNRVNEILKSSKIENWSWVPSEVNIADLGTRDNQKNLCSDSIWFKGPEFLYENVSSWMNYFKAPSSESANIVENICMVISENAYIRRKLVLPNIERFNNLYNLLKVTAWIIRYINNLKAKVKNESLNSNSYVTVAEIRKAKQLWVKKVQQDSFKDDIDKNFQISTGSKSRLSRYNHNFDEDNILRLQGRLRSNKYLNEDLINPIVLDGDHKFTKLLIMDIHLKYQHFGIQTVLHEFKTKYWIPKMTSKIKQVIKHCLYCRLRNPQILNPSIGDLIPERLRLKEKSFTAVGIDYFGPYYVKIGRKMFPRYGVLFTCLTTRATHVEIAHTLTSDSCLMAIERMMSRRGQILLIISDNASNMKGASSDLLKCLKSLNPEDIGRNLVKYGIEWKFIPTKTPHFGGCWERMIGCFKKALSAVIPKNKNMTDEMLSTVFAKTEYILNTRPYIFESDDPNDPLSLSPMNVLIPRFVEVISIPLSSTTPISGKRQWRICENVVDNFWNRFIKEYVPSILNSKLRKYSHDSPITPGDLVYLKNKIERGRWPIGKVEQVFPGKDGVTRIAEIKYNGTEEKMSVRNLLKINFNDNLI